MAEHCGHKKIVSLNIVRIIAAFGTFFYHTYHNFDCRYGKLDYVVSQSTFYMTTFFVLSGFVIFYMYNDTSFFSKAETLKQYIAKRFMSLFPTYFLVYTVFFFIFRNSTNIQRDIVAFPFQISLTFEFEHYDYMVNGGAWFFSLIFLCYFFTPYIIFLMHNLSKKIVIGSALFAIICVSCAPYLQVMVYCNFFMRFFEYYIGMVLAFVYLSYKESVFNKIGEKKILILTLGLYLSTFCLIYYCQQKIEQVGLNHTFLAPINIVMSSLIIYIAAHSEGKLTEIVTNNIVVATLSKYSLEIWVGTFFSSYIYAVMFAGKITGTWLITLAILLNSICVIILAIYRHYVQLLIKKNIYAYFIIAGLLFVVAAMPKIFGL